MGSTVRSPGRWACGSGKWGSDFRPGNFRRKRSSRRSDRARCTPDQAPSDRDSSTIGHRPGIAASHIDRRAESSRHGTVRRSRSPRRNIRGGSSSRRSAPSRRRQPGLHRKRRGTARRRAAKRLRRRRRRRRRALRLPRIRPRARSSGRGSRSRSPDQRRRQSSDRMDLERRRAGRSRDCRPRCRSPARARCRRTVPLSAVERAARP